MIPWETMSCRPFKTVIFLVLLLCYLVRTTDSRPVEGRAESGSVVDLSRESIANTPKIISNKRSENREYGSKLNTNTSMVLVRVVVSSSSSSSSDSDGEFAGFPAFQFVSSTTTTTTTEAPSTTHIKPTLEAVNRSRGQNNRYFLRPKRISAFTAKTTVTPRRTTIIRIADSPASQANENDAEKTTRLSALPDIFSVFYRAFSQNKTAEDSSSSLTTKITQTNDKHSDNDSSPLMSDSQNVERFQVYPQQIKSKTAIVYNSNSKSSNNNDNNNNRRLYVEDSSRNGDSESERGAFGTQAKVVSVVSHTKSVAVNTHRSSKHVITNSRPLPVRVRPIYQPKAAEISIDSVTIAAAAATSTLKNSTPNKSGRSPIIVNSNFSRQPPPPNDVLSPSIAQARIQDSPNISSTLYSTLSNPSTLLSTSTVIPTTTPSTTVTTQKSSRTTTKSWQQPETVWGQPAKVWGTQGQVWGEPEKQWGEPAKNWRDTERPSWLRPEPSLKFQGKTYDISTTLPTTTTSTSTTTTTDVLPLLFSGSEEITNSKMNFSLEDEEEDNNSKGSFFQLGEDEEEEEDEEPIDNISSGGKSKSWELPELSTQVDHTFVGGRVASVNSNNQHSSSYNNNNKQPGGGGSSSSSSSSIINSGPTVVSTSGRKVVDGETGNRNFDGNSNRDSTKTILEADKEKSGKKFGYVLEGSDVRKYRVEERTPDGYIVGEYGVLNNENGFLRGVRYTADGTINPRLIHEALMKFLSL